MKNDPTVIVSFARSPIGNLLGELKDITATELAGACIRAAIKHANLQPSHIHEVIMGCVLPAGLGQAPARQAALKADIPSSTPCTTINKVCGSGMKAVMFADDLLQCHSTDIMVVGGMESMTNAPYMLKNARQGYRLGHRECYDHMMLDGLEDAQTGQAMGFFAEQCATRFGFSREQQDAYALTSFERARAAIEKNLFAAEITPITVSNKKADISISQDEHPFSVNLERIASLAPAFVKNGTVTAGNASCIADGAAALTLMRLSTAEKLGVQPLARIVAKSSFAKAPSEFTTAPIDAMQLLFQKVQWQTSAVDLFEINEAFAVVAMAAMRALNIPHEKLNIHGGAIALGHPIGASGARIIVTLLSALQQNNLKRGVASLCIGGGEATAIAIEMYS